MPEDKRQRFARLARQSGRAAVQYLPVEERTFADAPLHLKWISKETYYRLLAQELLPESVKRILYLDADMVVMQSLQELYETNFEDKLLVACNRKKAGEIEAKRLEQLTLPPDTIYFNAGMLLYNLEEQRRQIDPGIYQEYLRLFAKWLTYQDVLNAVFYGQTKFVDYRLYNVFDCDIVNEEKKKRALRRTVVFHYNGMGKPWSEKYHGRMADVFWQYAQKIPEFEGGYEMLRPLQENYKKEYARKKAAETRKKRKEQRKEEEKVS